MAIASDAKDRLNVRVAERRNSGDLGTSTFRSHRAEPGCSKVLRKG